MAVVDVKKKWSGKGADIQKDQNSLTDRWTVLVDDLATDAIEVVSHPDLPRLQDAHETNTSYYAKRKFISEQKGPLFTVAIEFIKKTGANGVEDPAFAPVEIWGSGVSRVEQFDSAFRDDVNSDARDVRVLNSAQQPYETNLSDDVYDLEINFKRIDIGEVDAPTLWAYMGAVNLDTFWVFPPGVCKMHNIIFRQVIVPMGYPQRWEKQYIVHARLPKSVIQQHFGVSAQTDGTIIGGDKRAWFSRIMDLGYDELVGVDSETGAITHQIIRDKIGGRLSQPVPLDGLGRKRNSPHPPIWFEYRTAKHLNFAALGIM